MPVTLKKKTVEAPAPEPDKATLPAEPAAPQKSGTAYALTCIFAIVAIIVFAVLIFLQWKETAYYAQ